MWLRQVNVVICFTLSTSVHLCPWNRAVKFHVFEEYSSIDNDDELASLRPSKRFLNTRMSRIKNPRTSNHLNSRSYNMPYVQNNF